MPINDQQQWLQTPLGNYFQAQEQQLYDKAVVDVFGFNAVQIGMLQLDLLQQSRIPFNVRTDIYCRQDVDSKITVMQETVCCDSTQLAFKNNSIDLLLLPHTLEFSQNPHQTLREAERVLVPEGHIMITGFNPLSLWGLKRLTIKRRAEARHAASQCGYPWNGNFLHLLRIKDWLSLLGFEMVSGSMACYIPPFSSSSWMHRFEFMDKTGDRWWPMMGGVYFIVAKKRVVGMRVIRPSWKKPALKSNLVSAPTQKND